MNKVNHEGNDFVEIVSNALPEGVADKLIDNFERLYSMGMTYDRQSTENTSKGAKQDDSFGFNNSSLGLGILEDEPATVAMRSIKEYTSAYMDKYEAGLHLQNTQTFSVEGAKLQRTVPGGGYHVWHSENTDSVSWGRVIFFILYLNDIEEGGETEFLFLGKRVKPKKNTLVIAPAGFTHCHRGNPPLKETKYIITGWVRLL